MSERAIVKLENIVWDDLVRAGIISDRDAGRIMAAVRDVRAEEFDIGYEAALEEHGIEE